MIADTLLYVIGLKLRVFPVSGNKHDWVTFRTKGIAEMADGPDKLPSAPDRLSLVQRLVKEANITEEQARELIALLGSHWPSLMREARFLSRKR
ncbi:MAG: hypothetical protein E5V71_08915 [Mesorhizobium sp.]|nr:MAG: hypothetical protein E5V71_08915 [Mesorhizobium sp.]